MFTVHVQIFAFCLLLEAQLDVVPDEKKTIDKNRFSLTEDVVKQEHLFLGACGFVATIIHVETIDSTACYPLSSLFQNKITLTMA